MERSAVAIHGHVIDVIRSTTTLLQGPSRYEQRMTDLGDIPKLLARARRAGERPRKHVATGNWFVRSLPLKVWAARAASGMH